MDEEEELKVKVAKACRILHHEGLADFLGHVSARIPETDKILIKPRATSLESVTPKDILTVHLDGRKLDGRSSPPGELLLHTSIYRVRSDVGSVVHVHPPIAIAFTITGKEILPVCNKGAVFAEGIPVFDSSLLIRTNELGKMVADKLGKHYALLLRGHGAVTVGRSVEEACVRAIYLEETAKIQLLASIIGTPRPLIDEEIKDAPREREFPSAWSYYESRIPWAEG